MWLCMSTQAGGPQGSGDDKRHSSWILSLFLKACANRVANHVCHVHSVTVWKALETSSVFVVFAATQPASSLSSSSALRGTTEDSAHVRAARSHHPLVQLFSLLRTGTAQHWRRHRVRDNLRRSIMLKATDVLCPLLGKMGCSDFTCFYNLFYRETHISKVTIGGVQFVPPYLHPLCFNEYIRPHFPLTNGWRERPGTGHVFSLFSWLRKAQL